MRVLVIEDDAVQTAMIAAQFRRYFEYEVVFADSLENGKAFLRSMAVDAIVLDLSLPDSPGGVDTYLEIRQMATGIPVIVYTAAGDPELAQECISKGAHDYLCKDQSTFLPRVIKYAIERFKSQRALHKKNRELARMNCLYRSILDLSPEYIVRFSVDCSILFINKPLAALLGVSAEEAVGRCITDFTVSPSSPESNCLALLTPSNPVSSSYEKMTNGRWISWVYAGVFDRDGTLIEYQAIGRDVTSSRLSLQELVIEMTKATTEHQRALAKGVRDIMGRLASSQRSMDGMERGEVYGGGA